MGKELIINGKTKVCGKEIPNVYGGFGEGQKVILVKTVAELHDRELRKVNELINNHLSDGYFEENIDYIDLKNSVFLKDSLLKEVGFTKQSISNSKNIYLLSQQGYTLLLKLLDTELARKQYKEVIRKYFAIQEAIHYLTKEELAQLVAREDGIVRRNRETEVISSMIKNGELQNIRCNPYALVTNTTYDLLYGMYKNEILQYLNLKERDNLRDFLSERDLVEIREIEDEIHWMHKKGYTWKEIYDDLLKEYPKPVKKPEKAEKSIKELRKCKGLVCDNNDIKKLK